VRLYRKRKTNGEWVWWATWSEPHPLTGRTVTRRRSTGCNTKPAAEIVLARWEREQADPVYAAANEATFGAEAARFLESCEGAVERGKMAAPTLDMYRQRRGRWCACSVVTCGSRSSTAQLARAGAICTRMGRENGWRVGDELP
jgi:hypothetical protein